MSAMRACTSMTRALTIADGLTRRRLIANMSNSPTPARVSSERM